MPDQPSRKESKSMRDFARDHWPEFRELCQQAAPQGESLAERVLTELTLAEVDAFLDLCEGEPMSEKEIARIVAYVKRRSKEDHGDG